LKISNDSQLANIKIFAARELVDKFSYENRVVKILDFLKLPAN
jgi:hypothetical protein